MNEFLQCQETARQIVERYRAEAPLGYDPVAFDVGGGTSNTDSRFARTGTSSVAKEYSLPSSLSSLLLSAQGNAQVPSQLAGAETSYLTNMLSRAAGSVPGLSLLQALQQIDPASFTGSSALSTLMSRNPYSTDYENATGALYNRMFNQARAQAQSGPANVRGGTARQAFELADVGTQQSLNRFKEVRGQQDREAGVVRDAVHVFNTIEAMRRGTQLQSQGQQQQGEAQRDQQMLGASDAVNRMRTNNIANLSTAAEFLSKPTQTTTENLSGKGNQVQNTSTWGAGLTCCFIFMEALGVDLPWYVRKGRDEFATGYRIVGYRWMSKWLVPWMRDVRMVRTIVLAVLVRPFLVHGRWFYEDRRGWKGPVLLPYCWSWLFLWGGIGRFLKLKERLYGFVCRNPKSVG